MSFQVTSLAMAARGVREMLVITVRARLEVLLHCVLCLGTLVVVPLDRHLPSLNAV